MAGAIVKSKTGPIGGFLRALSKARFFFKQLWKAMTLPMKALGKLNVGFGLLSGAIEFPSGSEKPLRGDSQAQRAVCFASHAPLVASIASASSAFAKF